MLPDSDVSCLIVDFAQMHGPILPRQVQLGVFCPFQKDKAQRVAEKFINPEFGQLRFTLDSVEVKVPENNCGISTNSFIFIHNNKRRARNLFHTQFEADSTNEQCLPRSDFSKERNNVPRNQLCRKTTRDPDGFFRGMGTDRTQFTNARRPGYPGTTRPDRRVAARVLPDDFPRP